ncbi:hypothetical protein FA10DRAFT_264876 [Acaromyces ingoldii]|uniref:Copper acquisition factor BIM1-like domain-containing protein n=1 Tax=Acaromyces ingoldii TaxID=215250 RepID=A0A316YZX2_9BASI|nr:hypothetical protein FA10DRAFT_264876 [Acaromyces ingoldii]PWN94334.1 hypothetical protein FA10DRAFT_264876 [Acaromyces ingoldii]
MQASLISLVALAALPAAVSAHFQLQLPKSRGFDEDIENEAPCGGFNASATRAPWYYQKGPIQINSEHDTATVNIYVSYDSNPTTLTSFTSNALKTDVKITGEGEFCFNNNVAGTQATNGVNATLMVEYISTVHGHLYQCSDVTFSSNQTLNEGITCTDALTATKNLNDAAVQAAGGETSNSSSSNTSNTTTSSGSTSSHHDGAIAFHSDLLVLLSVTVGAACLGLAVL